MNIFALDDRFTDFEYPLRIEADVAQRVIQRQHRSRYQRNTRLLRSRAKRAQRQQCAQKPMQT